MPIPPKLLLREKIRSAEVTTRCAGFVSITLGLIVLMLWAGVAAQIGAPWALSGIVTAAVAIVYLVPGLLFLLFAWYIGAEQKTWAMVATICIGALQIALMVLNYVVALLKNTGDLVSSAMTLTLLLVQVYTITRLSQAIAALQADHKPTGFQVITNPGDAAEGDRGAASEEATAGQSASSSSDWPEIR